MDVRRLLALLARAPWPGPLAFAGMVLVAVGGWMAWRPAGAILMGMALIITGVVAAVVRSDGP